MKTIRIIALLLIGFACRPINAQIGSYVPDSEKVVAEEYLRGQGVNPDSMHLVVTQREENCTLFTDDINRLFVLVANKRLWPIIKDPIIAYSIESSFASKTVSPDCYKSIITPYLNQLKVLEKNFNDSLIHVNMDVQGSIKPLLQDLRWGQGRPYNIKAPTVIKTQKKTNIGCIPLAMAMVMKYHKWPDKGMSHVYYSPYDSIYKIDFTENVLHWENYKNDYAPDDTIGVSELAQLLNSLGMAVDAKYTAKVTSASLWNIKHILCNNLGYSGKLNCTDSTQTSRDLIMIIYQELKKGRPCLVTSDSHAFVCDGFKDGFLHFNFGWNGMCNGYYRPDVGNGLKTQNNMLIKRLVYGIEPEYKQYSRSVKLQKAGTLATVLSQEEMENVTSLQIEGPLNGCDIILLRRMAGALTDTLYNWRGGALRHLDLSKAKIVSDKENAYLTLPEMGSWVYTESYGNKTKRISLDFTNMGEKEWKLFKNSYTAKHGIYICRSVDNQYWERICCHKNEIGKRMFWGCNSLNSIILPLATKYIGDLAFMGCSSLQKMHVPPKVTEHGNIPFLFCTSLEKIELPQSCFNVSPTARDCSPILMRITRYKP